MAGRVPEKLRDYEVSRLLGKGGMGEVFLANHPLLERHVAVKRFVFAAGKGDDEGQAKERFFREGRALARLCHHNIVQVHDLFEYRRQACMVLEYVDGFDLAEILKEGKLPVDVSVIIALKVAEALEHAHFAGIVHRDVKASNVMMSRGGEVKLMDFGIAKQDALEPMTKTGLVVGTPMYVAPEVVAGGEADARADLYALGALLYACLSGRRLFEHATPDNLFVLILAGRFPRLGKVASHVPWRLRSIVHRLLHNKAAKRFGSAAELRQALEIFLAEQDVGAHHAERLVHFLQSRGKLTDQEVEAWLEPARQSRSALTGASPARRPGRALRWGLAVAALAVAAASGAWLYGLTELQAALMRLSGG